MRRVDLFPEFWPYLLGLSVLLSVGWGVVCG